MSLSSMIGLIISIIGLLLSAVPIINNFAFLLLAISLILGIVGVIKTKKNKKRGRKLAITAVILSVIGIVVVIASQSFYGSVLDKTGDEINKSVDESTGKSTNKILGKDVDVKLGTFTAIPGEFMTNTKLPVTVKNKTKETKSYSIQIEAIDASGKRITDDTVSVDNLGANQSQDFKAFEYVEDGQIKALKSATFKVASVSQF